MNLHEYQTKEILQKYGVPVPEYGVVGRALDIPKVLSHLRLKEAVIKIQVHAGEDDMEPFDLRTYVESIFGNETR